MDPNAAYQELLALMASREDDERMEEVARGLYEWLRRGGFAPQGVNWLEAGKTCMNAILTASH